MRIAVTSQDFRSVTGHAGRARRFIVFEADGKGAPKEIERLKLDPGMEIHGFDQRAAHPLDAVEVLVTAGSGQGFVRHMAARGVQVVATSERDPAQAIEVFLAGRLMSVSSSGRADPEGQTARCNDADDGLAHRCGCRS